MARRRRTQVAAAAMAVLAMLCAPHTAAAITGDGMSRQRRNLHSLNQLLATLITPSPPLEHDQEAQSTFTAPPTAAPTAPPPRRRVDPNTGMKIHSLLTDIIGATEQDDNNNDEDSQYSEAIPREDFSYDDEQQQAQADEEAQGHVYGETYGDDYGEVEAEETGDSYDAMMANTMSIQSVYSDRKAQRAAAAAEKEKEHKQEVREEKREKEAEEHPLGSMLIGLANAAIDSASGGIPTMQVQSVENASGEPAREADVPVHSANALTENENDKEPNKMVAQSVDESASHATAQNASYATSANALTENENDKEPNMMKAQSVDESASHATVHKASNATSSNATAARAATAPAVQAKQESPAEGGKQGMKAFVASLLTDGPKLANKMVGGASSGADEAETGKAAGTTVVAMSVDMDTPGVQQQQQQVKTQQQPSGDDKGIKMFVQGLVSGERFKGSVNSQAEAAAATAPAAQQQEMVTAQSFLPEGANMVGSIRQSVVNTETTNSETAQRQPSDTVTVMHHEATSSTADDDDVDPGTASGGWNKPVGHLLGGLLTPQPAAGDSSGAAPAAGTSASPATPQMGPGLPPYPPYPGDAVAATSVKTTATPGSTQSTQGLGLRDLVGTAAPTIDWRNSWTRSPTIRLGGWSLRDLDALGTISSEDASEGAAAGADKGDVAVTVQGGKTFRDLVGTASPTLDWRQFTAESTASPTVDWSGWLTKQDEATKRADMSEEDAEYAEETANMGVMRIQSVEGDEDTMDAQQLPTPSPTPAPKRLGARIMSLVQAVSATPAPTASPPAPPSRRATRAERMQAARAKTAEAEEVAKQASVKEVRQSAVQGFQDGQHVRSQGLVAHIIGASVDSRGAAPVVMGGVLVVAAMAVLARRRAGLVMGLDGAEQGERRSLVADAQGPFGRGKYAGYGAFATEQEHGEALEVKVEEAGLEPSGSASSDDLEVDVMTPEEFQPL